MEPLLITSPNHMVCEWPHNQSNLGISVIYTKEGSTIFKHFFNNMNDANKQRLKPLFNDGWLMQEWLKNVNVHELDILFR